MQPLKLLELLRNKIQNICGDLETIRLDEIISAQNHPDIKAWRIASVTMFKIFNLLRQQVYLFIKVAS